MKIPDFPLSNRRRVGRVLLRRFWHARKAAGDDCTAPCKVCHRVLLQWLGQAIRFRSICRRGSLKRLAQPFAIEAFEIGLEIVHDGIAGRGRFHLVHAFPTQAQGIKMAGDAYRRTRFTSLRRRLAARWLAWSRR